MTFKPNGGQTPPTWSVWGMSAGRGAGKSEAAIQWFNSYMKSSEGFRGLIVVPHVDDIKVMAGRFQEVNEDIIYENSKRRLTWASPMSFRTLRLDQAKEALSRLQDLPVNSRIRQLAEVEHSEAVKEVNRSLSMAFIASADDPNSVRGVQAHISFLDDVQNFSKETDSAQLNIIDNARVATRLGLNPQIVVTHTTNYPKFKDAIYTMG